EQAPGGRPRSPLARRIVLRAAGPARSPVRRVRPQPRRHRGPARRVRLRPRQPRPDRGRGGRHRPRARRAAGPLQPARRGAGHRPGRGFRRDRHVRPAQLGRHRQRGRRRAAQGDDPHAPQDHRPALGDPGDLHGGARPLRRDLCLGPRRHRQDLSRRRPSRAAADWRIGGPADPFAPGSGGGRAARLSARRHEGKGRSLSPPALRRALRHAARRAGRAPHRLRRDRDRAARLHARADAGGGLHHLGRGAEHHAAADEDVPHPLRHAQPHGDLRRPEAGGPAQPRPVGARRRRGAAGRGGGRRHRALRPRRRGAPPARRQDRRGLRGGRL
ncbi:MAG: Phosphate starvation-inducible protein PhoH, predicted ATPase, partial [uncultured Sphingomonadaceae bacterium]